MKKSLIYLTFVLVLVSCSQPRVVMEQKSSEERTSVSVESLTTQTSPEKKTILSRDSVLVLLDYLKVYPTELGDYPTEPKSIINQINAQAQYGYNSWRIPTEEELSLLRSNRLIGDGEYMSIESKRGIVLLVTEKNRISKNVDETIQIEEIQNNGQEWVDLGLQSRTLWKSVNEDGFYTFDQAISQYGQAIPSLEQMAELMAECKWEWHNNEYKIIGPNGSFIILPAQGYQYCNGDTYGVGVDGEYWTSTPEVTVNAMRLFFNKYGKGMNFNYRCRGRSVRLVKNK